MNIKINVSYLKNFAPALKETLCFSIRKKSLLFRGKNSWCGNSDVKCGGTYGEQWRADG